MLDRQCGCRRIRLGVAVAANCSEDKVDHGMLLCVVQRHAPRWVDLTAKRMHLSCCQPLAHVVYRYLGSFASKSLAVATCAVASFFSPQFLPAAVLAWQLLCRWVIGIQSGQ